MYNKIYERKEFMIFQVREGYIVYNAKKSFQEGHTHLKHFEAAKTAIDLVIRKKIPKSTHGYYLTSLIRLSEDDCYINKIKELSTITREINYEKELRLLFYFYYKLLA